MKMKIKIILLSVLLLITTTFTVIYAWQNFERIIYPKKYDAFNIKLNLVSVEKTNTKKLVPTKYWFFANETDKYTYYYEDVYLLETLTNESKKEHYQKILDQYNISLINAPEELLLRVPISTPNGIYLEVYLDEEQFINREDYKTWAKLNTQITFGFNLTFKT